MKVLFCRYLIIEPTSKIQDNVRWAMSNVGKFDYMELNKIKRVAGPIGILVHRRLLLMFIHFLFEFKAILVLLHILTGEWGSNLGFRTVDTALTFPWRYPHLTYNSIHTQTQMFTYQPLFQTSRYKQVNPATTECVYYIWSCVFLWGSWVSPVQYILSFCHSVLLVWPLP